MLHKRWHRVTVSIAVWINSAGLGVDPVLKAWSDPAQKNPKTIHHHGYGRFAVDGEMIKLKSRIP